MSTPSMYTLVDRIDDRGTPMRKRNSVTRLQVPQSIGTNATSIRYELPVVHIPDELKADVDYSFTNNDYEILKAHENILFIYLDLHSQLTSGSLNSLRTINHAIQTYTDTFSCLDFLRSSEDRIFLILSSIDKQLIEECHNIQSVEAIFILNSDGKTDSRFPKLYGVYTHFEELILALKSTLEWFEQTQMELFVFERDRIFLWSQLWKEEYIKPKKSKQLSNKEKLIDLAEHYYRGNSKSHQIINEFNQSYDKNDALKWCFNTPFPSNFLRSALRSHHSEHLHACRFLINDVSRIIQQSEKKSSCELYKGMKMGKEFLDKLEKHVGEFICSKGFLLCHLSRKIALEIANSPDHRPDLMPVLFKITYDRSVPIAEIIKKNTPTLMVFDVYTVFRVKYINRGQVSIIKIEPADEDGRKRARDYRMKYQSESVENILEQLLSPPKPPTKLPPPQQSMVPKCVTPDLSPNEVSLSIIPEQEDDDNDETRAQRLVDRDEIDQAIAIYEKLKPDSRILSILGQLYADKKRDYEPAINYYKKALKMQEKKGEDVTNTLSQLGNIHQNRREFDLALACHSRALHKRKKIPDINQALIANNYMGMANAYWSQQNLTEALNYAQQALVINEAIESGNEAYTAANLAILANIYHNAGETRKALEIATKALSQLERSVPPDSPTLGTLINNVATIQVANGLLTDARHNFGRALEICKKSYPEGHPTRITMENNLQRINDMEKPRENVSEA